MKGQITTQHQENMKITSSEIQSEVKPLSRYQRFKRSTVFISASILLYLTQGLGVNLVAVNISQLQGSLSATQTEMMWLVAAYMAPNVSLTILLTKIRLQFGLRKFAERSIILFCFVSLLHLSVHDLYSGIIIRFLAGLTAAPISSIAYLYMLEAFSAQNKRKWGPSLALTCLTITPVIARLISPALLDLGQWTHLYSLEIGLALCSLAVIHFLHLTPPQRIKVLHWKDFITYPLLATGLGLIAIVLVLGRFYWWFEAPWIGLCLAIASISLACAIAIEINRDTPLINIQWLMSPEIVQFALTMLIFKIILSEQTTGAFNLFSMLGLLNEQSRTLYIFILLSSVAGGITCGFFISLERVPYLHWIALLCIVVGAFMDAHVTNLTRPQNMYLSQSLIAYGAGLFLPPSQLTGILKTMQRGPIFLTSFITIVLLTQSLGALAGSALFGTFVTIREKFHSHYLVEQIILSNQGTTAYIQKLTGSISHVINDPQLLHAEGIALLSQKVTKEASILAYNDAFMMIALIAFMALLFQTGYICFLMLRRHFSDNQLKLS